MELLREFLILDDGESLSVADTPAPLLQMDTHVDTPPPPLPAPPVFPQIDFSVTLKMCCACVAFMVNNLAPLERNTSGLTPLTFHLCDVCYLKNKIGHSYFRE